LDDFVALGYFFQLQVRSYTQRLKTKLRVLPHGVTLRRKLFLMSSIVIILLGATTTFYSVNALSSSFGHVGVGESSKTTFGGMLVSNFTSPSDLGNITQINVYLSSGGTSAKAVIYSDIGGTPNILLAQSSTLDLEGTSGRWVPFAISYLGTANTTYWLGVLFSSAGTYYYSSNVNGRAIYSSPVTDATNTFTEATLNPNENLSIYAVYTSSSSSNPRLTKNSWVEPILLVVAISGLIVAIIVAGLAYSKKRNSRLLL
jgi:hypothetical protein